MKIKNTEIKIIKVFGKTPQGLAVSWNKQLKGKNVFSAYKYFQGKNEDVKIRNSASAAILYGHKHRSDSLVLFGSSISVSTIPVKGVAKILAQEALKYFRTQKSVFKEIIFCLDNEEDYQVYKKYVVDYMEYMLFKMQHGPYLTVDMVIELKEGVVVIERSNPPYGWALPGGFVDYGETVEDAAVREAKEETDLKVKDIRLLGVYSEPTRDPRFHTVASVFVGKGIGKPKAGDDAQALKVVPYKDLERFPLAFDHGKIVKDYMRLRRRT